MFQVLGSRFQDFMRQCSICHKSYIYIITRKKSRSKYNPTSRQKKRANLQWARLSFLVAGRPDLVVGKRIKACAKCIKKIYKK